MPKTFKKICYSWNIFNFLCNIVHIFGTSPGNTIIIIFIFLLPVQLMVANMHGNVNIGIIIIHSCQLGRFRHIKPCTINKRTDATEPAKRNSLVSQNITIVRDKWAEVSYCFRPSDQNTIGLWTQGVLHCAKQRVQGKMNVITAAASTTWKQAETPNRRKIFSLVPCTRHLNENISGIKGQC